MSDAVFESLLSHSVTIQRPTDTVDGVKAPTITYVTQATGVACRVKPVRADTKQAIAGMVFDSSHKAYFLPAAVIREQDRVVNGTDTYRVVGVELAIEESALHHQTVHLLKEGPVA